MARVGLLLSVCAVAVLLGTVSPTGADATDERSQVIAASLAVQVAIQQGRDHLLRGDARAAVELLESQLINANGNPHYLTLLRDAYRAHIRDLELTNSPASRAFRERLVILEHGVGASRVRQPAGTQSAGQTKPPAGRPAVAEERVPTAVAPKPVPAVQVERVANVPAVQVQRSASVPTPAPAPTQAAAQAPRPPEKPAAPSAAPQVAAAVTATPPATPASPSSKAPLFRLKGEDEIEDLFRLPLAERLKEARSYLERAEQAFGQRRYHDAGILYEKAYRIDPVVIETSRERWAYCLLHHVVAELKQPTHADPSFLGLEKDVRTALQLAPRLEYGKQLLADIETRRKPEPKPSVSAHSAPEIVVRHLDPSGGEDWHITETANFRIFHNEPTSVAEQVARTAEETRVQMQKKWFGTTGPVWSPRCEIYLHANGAEYCRATGAPSDAPGHSTMKFEGARIVSRRIDLRGDSATLLKAELPHETTHTVLAGNFGEKSIPRWADEGMAMLTESNNRVEEYLRKLPQYRQNRQLFPLHWLMPMADYPDASHLNAFYAESVSLVEFMVRLKGAQQFTQFLREGMYSGYEPALQKHYGFRSYNELEENWVKFAFEGGRAKDQQ